MKRSSTDPRWLAVCLVVGLAVVPYLNGLRAEFTFDDYEVIRDNPMIQSEPVSNLFLRPYLVYAYRPLTLLTYVMNDRISDAVTGYRIANIILHALVSVGVLAIGWAIVRSAAVATAAAAIFAVHPIHTEAVTSIVGRSELLAAFFILAALLAFVRSLRAAMQTPNSPFEKGGSRGICSNQSVAKSPLTPLFQRGASKRRRGLGWQALAALFFAGGLLSKESALSAVGLFPILHWWTVGRLDWRRVALASVPFAVLAAAYLALRFAVVGAVSMPGPPSLIDNPLAHVATGPRIATALVVLWEYVSQLTFPHYLSADYSFNEIPIVTSVLDPRLLLAASGLAACVLAGALAARRAPEVAVAAALFVVPISLTANVLFPIGTIKAERLLYLPSVGWCLLLSWLLCAVFRNRRHARVLLLVAVVSACAVRTSARNRDWHDNAALFESAVEASPDSAKAHYNLGTVYYQAGRLDAAAVHFRRSLEIYPDSAKVAFGIGEIYAQKNIDGGAVAWYERALRLDWFRPKFHLKLGMLRYRLGENDAAIAAFLTGLRLDPEHRSLNLNLAIAELREGDGWSAWEWTERAAAAAAGDPHDLAFVADTRRIIRQESFQ